MNPVKEVIEKNIESLKKAIQREKELISACGMNYQDPEELEDYKADLKKYEKLLEDYIKYGIK